MICQAFDFGKQSVISIDFCEPLKERFVAVDAGICEPLSTRYSLLQVNLRSDCRVTRPTICGFTLNFRALQIFVRPQRHNQEQGKIRMENRERRAGSRATTYLTDIRRAHRLMAELSALLIDSSALFFLAAIIPTDLGLHKTATQVGQVLSGEARKWDGAGQ